MTMSSVSRAGAIADDLLSLPGRDARDLVPDVRNEALQVVKDSIRGDRPSTVLGVLIDRMRPIELVTIAGLISTPLPQVHWTVEVLEAEGFCRSHTDDAIQMVELARADAVTDADAEHRAQVVGAPIRDDERVAGQLARLEQQEVHEPTVPR